MSNSGLRRHICRRLCARTLAYIHNACGVCLGGVCVFIAFIFGREGLRFLIVVIVFAVKLGIYFLPVVFARRTVESSEYEHQNLGAHTHGQQHITAGKVEYFEECAPDDDGGAYGVRKIEEALAFGA